eukprot:3071534-Rhodomonas_salina.4
MGGTRGGSRTRAGHDGAGHDGAGHVPEEGAGHEDSHQPRLTPPPSPASATHIPSPTLLAPSV